MGINYKVFCFDDHLGILSGRDYDQECAYLNGKLEKLGANIEEPFEYVSIGDCLIGDFRNSHPTWYKEAFSYDAVYWMADTDTVLTKL